MTTAMAVTEETTSLLGASRKLSLSGRRNQRAAGERVAGLFEEYGRMVYSVCQLVLRDPVEAEDLRLSKPSSRPTAGCSPDRSPRPS